MSSHNWILLVIFIVFIQHLCCQPPADENYSPAQKCLGSKHHKPSPDKSHQLHNLCHQWSNYSCCTNVSSISAHNQVNHYGFNITHCGQNSVSNLCRNYFTRDLCYYDCDPYVLPFIRQQKRSFASERLFMVPMCKKDCLKWWDACKSSSYTCVRNWAKHFKWVKNPATTTTTKKTNICPEGTQCATFENIYKDAVDFCETVWDNSWKVVNDSVQCVELEFDGSHTNPNKRVAEWYLENLVDHKNGRDDSNYIYFFMALIIFYIGYRLIKFVLGCINVI